MAATTKLIVYNEALREIGAAPLINTSTANTRLLELDGAFNHAVEYMLARKDWGFARRRATLTATADTTFSPYTQRYTKPTDYLRKCWIKTTAADPQQLDHAEIAAVFYGFAASVLIEYVSDHADNYDPVNWPPHFTRCAVLSLANQVAPRLARAGSGDLGMLDGKLTRALDEAEAFESVFLTNEQITVAREPIFRRAIELMGQTTQGSVAVGAEADRLRWAMNRTYDSCVRFVLEQAPWRFAMRRATLTGVSDSTTFPPYTFKYVRPASFLKTSWVRTTATDTFEADYAEAGVLLFGTAASLAIEYWANDSAAVDPTNWPSSFAESVALYLAAQVANPTIVDTDREGKRRERPTSVRTEIMQQFQAYMSQAAAAQTLAYYDKSVAANRLPVMRRALELIGQPLTGTDAENARSAEFRWQMNQTWDQCVKFVLEQAPWNFATRRSTLTGVSDTTTFPPYTFKYVRPASFLRRNWVRTTATDTFEADIAESGALLFGSAASLVMEYWANDANAIDPANWPASFTEAMAIYLATQVAPPTIIETDREGRRLSKPTTVRSELTAMFSTFIEGAKSDQAIAFYDKTITASKLPVIRRAIELMGQQLGGTVAINEESGKLRWAINQTWDQGVKFCLEQGPWNFASRRATLTGVSDTTTFPPFTFKYNRPAGFLKRTWVRAVATDTFEADYAESGILLFGYAASQVMEYTSNDSAAIDPANWPASFTEVVALYLAAQVSGASVMVRDKDGKTSEAPSSLRTGLMQMFTAYLADAQADQAIAFYDKSITAVRLPVIRRTIELIGQQLGGSVALNEESGKLRWQINQTFDNCVRFVLEQGPWNFASRRVTLTGVSDSTTFPPYTFKYVRPASFVKRNWVRTAATDAFEADYAESGVLLFGTAASLLMEYTANDSSAVDPTNWPSRFAEVVALYMAAQVAGTSVQVRDRDGKVSDAPSSLRTGLMQMFTVFLAEAQEDEAIAYTDKTVTANKLPVMRRAAELMGQQLTGSRTINTQSARMRWQMNQAWDACLKHVLEQAPWNFATRRATLTGVSDTTTFPPYTFKYTRPASFVKRNWVRVAATDTFDADFAESGTSLFGYAASLKLDYVANDANAIDPTTWPAVFLETFALYLAAQTAPATSITTDKAGQPHEVPSSARSALMGQFAGQLQFAQETEAILYYDKAIATNRLPVMRRMVEFLGQQLNGSIAIQAHAARLRWHADQAWTHAVEYVLEMGAWNFASRRVTLTTNTVPLPGSPTTKEYEYGYTLPSDFVHKIWLRADANNEFEAHHQFLKAAVYTNVSPIELEYVSNDSAALDPANWSMNFLEAVAAYLALMVAPEFVVEVNAKSGAKINAAQVRDKLEKNFQAKLSDAKLRDAIQQEPVSFPLGRFARARMGGSAESLRRLN